MTLLSGARRYLAVAILIGLAIPALAMTLQPLRTVSIQEKRTLAPVPAAPHSLADARALPQAIDAFVADHFAFRDPMVRAAGRLFGKARVGPSGLPAAIDAKSGRMLLVNGILRSTGQDMSEGRARDYAAFVCAASRRLDADGAVVVFAIAPSPTTIYPEDAPTWALPRKTPTEQDLILAGVRACGARALDMRPALRAGRARHPMYRRTDTHWTERGAMLAFNVLARDLGRTDWVIDTEALPWTETTVTTGDLPPLAGRDPVAERIETTKAYDLPAGIVSAPLTGADAGPFDAPFAVDMPGEGPRVVIIGDSFSKFFVRYLAPHARRVVWIHHEVCALDWNSVTQQRADYVLIVPAERFADCNSGTRPKNFPPSAATPPTLTGFPPPW